MAQWTGWDGEAGPETATSSWAQATCRRLRQEKRAAGWLEVMSETFEDGIAQTQAIAFPNPGGADQLKDALQDLMKLSEQLDGPAEKRPPATLTAAVGDGDGEAVRAFLAKGADANERTVGFASALVPAAGAGNLELVELLLASGAHPDP